MLGALIGPNRCWGSKSASRAQILPQWSLNTPQVESRSDGSGKWAAQIGGFRIGGQNQSPENRVRPPNGSSRWFHWCSRDIDKAQASVVTKHLQRSRLGQ